VLIFLSLITNCNQRLEAYTDKVRNKISFILIGLIMKRLAKRKCKVVSLLNKHQAMGKWEGRGSEGKVLSTFKLCSRYRPPSRQGKIFPGTYWIGGHVDHRLVVEENETQNFRSSSLVTELFVILYSPNFILPELLSPHFHISYNQ
jgi:hypothetical protein